jgi:hypothetical protein
MSLPPVFVPILVGLLFVTLPFTIARIWLRRIAARRRAYDDAERSLRLLALADASLAARRRGETFVPPPGWDR